MSGVRRASLFALLFTVLPALAGDQVPGDKVAGDEVPVGVRIIKGSRKGPAQVDPRLADLKRQLSPLAYVRWEQVSEKKLDLAKGKTEFVELPGGDTVGVTLQEHRGDALTLEVALTQRNTQSRLTVEKGQRIVHGVVPEKGGEAVFIVLTGWP